jgi:hypothetical protein
MKSNIQQAGYDVTVFKLISAQYDNNLAWSKVEILVRYKTF